jgi:hypothetical protein
VRAIATASREELQLQFPTSPPLTLEYSDPFAASADPASYIIVSAGSVGIAAAGGKKGAPAAAAAADGVGVGGGSRQQKKAILLCSAQCNDKRAGIGPGTFEIILGAEAKSSGIWSLSTEKGAITPAANASCDIMCTLPEPRSLGGLFVGSWKSYDATVVFNGGWCIAGEAAENRVKIVLRAFVSL